MSPKFEWDRRKATSNLSRHGVSFQEALSVFGDPLARIFDDEDHSIEEHRDHRTFSQRTPIDRLLTSVGESVRIFSARRASRKEREDYEENIKS